MSKLFSGVVMDDIRREIEQKGLENTDTNHLLILIADHFNDEISSIADNFNDEIASLEKKARRVGWAIFSAMASIAGSLIAGLIVALLKG